MESPPFAGALHLRRVVRHDGFHSARVRESCELCEKFPSGRETLRSARGVVRQALAGPECGGHLVAGHSLCSHDVPPLRRGAARSRLRRICRGGEGRLPSRHPHHSFPGGDPCRRRDVSRGRRSGSFWLASFPRSFNPCAFRRNSFRSCSCDRSAEAVRMASSPNC